MAGELTKEVSREKVGNNVSKCKVSSDEYDVHSGKGMGRPQEGAPDERGEVGRNGRGLAMEEVSRRERWVAAEYHR